MRVLFVTNMYPVPDRPTFGIFVQRMERALRGAGLEVAVEEVAGRRGPLDYARARRRVADAAKRWRADVVHLHFGYTFLASPSTHPRVVTFYGDDLNGESRGNGTITMKSRIGRWVSLRAAEACERSIAVSERLRANIGDVAVRARCAVIPDAVDTALFRPAPQAEARAALGLPADAVLVIFPHDAGVATKRVDLAERAVAELRHQLPSARLWIVNGKAPDSMPRHYAAADAMIVTSDFEGGPTSAKEALACGTPVVSVDVGDTETLRRVPSGAFVVDRSPDALARALALAIGGRPQSRRRLLPPDLDLECAARRVADVYEDALSRFARPRSTATA